eukprot:3188925-Alexandrium_andersonii.AAC.1
MYVALPPEVAKPGMRAKFRRSLRRTHQPLPGGTRCALRLSRSLASPGGTRARVGSTMPRWA